MEHTPGPWKAVPRSVLNDGTQDETGDGLGWDIEGPPEPQLRGQFKKAADAHLIATAPDFLKAAKLAVECFAGEPCPLVHDDDDPCWLELTISAIAKTTP